MISKEWETGNIGLKERSRLRTMGQVVLALGVLLAAVAIHHQAPWWVRPTLFFTLWMGVSALFQAKEQTSVLLAARRVRRIDGREEPERYVIELRKRARMIQRRSLFVTVLLMTLVTVLG